MGLSDQPYSESSPFRKQATVIHLKSTVSKFHLCVTPFTVVSQKPWTVYVPHLHIYRVPGVAICADVQCVTHAFYSLSAKSWNYKVTRRAFVFVDFPLSVWRNLWYVFYWRYSGWIPYRGTVGFGFSISCLAHRPSHSYMWLLFKQKISVSFPQCADSTYTDIICQIQLHVGVYLHKNVLRAEGKLIGPER